MTLRPAIVTGLLAGLIVFISDWSGIPGWVAFLTWTIQSFLEENGIGALGAVCAFAMGVLVAIVASATGQMIPVMSPAIGEAIAIGLACAVVVFCGGFARTRPASSGVFIGMIAWFGAHWMNGSSSPIALLMASGLGLLAHFSITRVARDRVRPSDPSKSIGG